MQFDIERSKLKFFYHPSFDESSTRTEIMADMPDWDNFQRNREKIHKIRLNKVNPEMMPCYESPLLTVEQERHLFRKMNFLRYRAQGVIAQIGKRPCKAKEKHARHLIKQANAVRNTIAESNFRLATMIMKHRESSTLEASNPDNILSDAYFDVLKAVDYFNWTLGIKFSTYATWVVKKNFFRDLKHKSTQSDRFCALDETKADLLEGRSHLDHEKGHASRQKLIKQLIGMLVRENVGTDRVRQAFVLENYFGINGKKKKTLEEISDEIGVTKERVRQLKERGLEWIKERVASIGLEYDNDNPCDSVL